MQIFLQKGDRLVCPEKSAIIEKQVKKLFLSFHVKITLPIWCLYGGVLACEKWKRVSLGALLKNVFTPGLLCLPLTGRSPCMDTQKNICSQWINNVRKRGGRIHLQSRKCRTFHRVLKQGFFLEGGSFTPQRAVTICTAAKYSNTLVKKP